MKNKIFEGDSPTLTSKKILIFFFMLMNNAVFEKTIENMKKHRNIQPMATQMWRTYVVSEANYHYYKVFHSNFISKKRENLKH